MAKVYNLVTRQNILNLLNKESLDFAIKTNKDFSVAFPVAWKNYQGVGLTFYTGQDAEALKIWAESEKSLIVVNKTLESLLPDGPFLFADKPKLIFSKICRLFVKNKPNQIHSSVIIHPEAVIGENVNIEPYSIIGKCTIGDNCVIGPKVYIGDDVVIGNNVNILSSANIGNEGLNVTRDDEGKLIQMHHFGRVVIQDNAWIGSNADIQRGVLEDTVIGDGSHIGSRAQLSHNCKIGRNVIMASGVSIAGSSKIGDNVYIGTGAFIRDQIEIAKGCTIGAMASVMQSIKKEDMTVMAPASKEIGKLFNWNKK